ncbi:RluA family pseudouridine synthase [Tyzzerella sp. OttesenSCG-928-J15]|nr:RluA family pseudouridine synthase [Tyzzerella sp. OttesenSCG-928-J15]
MNKDLIFSADETDADTRLDIYISENIPEFTRSFLKKHIEAENVTVNGKPQKAGFKLKAGDSVFVKQVESQIPDILPEKIDIDIVYEDDDLIVVNKPKGMVVHPAAGHYSATLVNALMYHCGGRLSGINGILRPGIVHRIDMDTSGILVAAKNDKAHKGLSEQFACHSITRVYEAVTVNVLKEDTLDINKPIGRSLNDRKKMCVTEKNSKPAITHIKVVERFGANTFIEARLETGRTHQIRVHMAYMGYPLVGDTVYGSAKDKYKTGGQALFAKTLGFVHPATGEYIEFQAERPLYMENLLLKLRGGKA